MCKEFLCYCLIASIFVNNCDGQKINYELPKNSRDAVERLRSAVDAFSYEVIMRSINDEPESNIVTSPFSIWSLLTILGEGAKGNTLKELNHVLRLPDQSTVRLGCKEIGRALFVNSSTVEFETINSFFYDLNTNLKEDFKSIVRSTYNTEFYNLNFRYTRKLEEINKKIREDTRGRIKEIINPNDLRNSKILLTNTVYFKGQWKLPFNKSMTSLKPFHDSHNNVIGNVNMMHSLKNFSYINMRKCQCNIVKLSYGEKSRLAMYIILPHYNITLEAVASNFANMKTDDLYRAMDEANDYFGEDDVDFYLPRFKISCDVVLNNLLNKMGINDIFDSVKANLAGMTEDNNLFLSKVIHKANIEVTEDGTEASAATAGSLANRNSPAKVIVNKPFIYFIAEERTHFIVLAGSYSKPELF